MHRSKLIPTLAQMSYQRFPGYSALPPQWPTHYPEERIFTGFPGFLV